MVLIFANLNQSTRQDTIVMDALARLDHETFLHCTRVQKLALLLGSEMGLCVQELDNLRLGALLHDIGKRDIPLHILNKEAPLTPGEWALIEEHPRAGLAYVEDIGLNQTVKGIILNHHVWANGRGGYPRLENDERPCLLTQIAAVADVADAMTSARPYRPALSRRSCLEFLQEFAGTRFNREVVAALGSLVSNDWRN